MLDGPHQTLPPHPHHHRIKRLKTHGPAWLALLIAALLYQALPKALYWGPRGLMISLVVALIIPIIISFWQENARISRILNLSVNILITLYMVVSVCRMVLAVLQGHIGPVHLLLSSIILWGTNILVFALWYWNLDAGGPGRRQREQNEVTRITAFLFPQAQIALVQDQNELPSAIKNWEPKFIDYLFLAFNTNTAFSPTDSPVLSRWAKCMFMVQAIVSLTIVVMFAARAVNILNPTTNYLVS